MFFFIMTEVTLIRTRSSTNASSQRKQSSQPRDLGSKSVRHERKDDGYTIGIHSRHMTRAVGKSIIQIQNSSNRINHLIKKESAAADRNMDFWRPF